MESSNYMLLLVILIYLFLTPTLSQKADSISANTSLSGNQTIISPGNIFVLGYFTPGNSSKFYLGIWYTISPKTVVWVANRNTPISDPSSSHTKIVAGNLVILNETQSEIWSTGLNSTRSSPNLQAFLLDSGNLILTSTNSSVWESFDFPTDTWLPGGSLGMNKRTGSNQLLISWKNSEDPAPGLFSLELDPTGSPPQYLLLWNRSRKYWTSGPWNGLIFAGVPEMTRNYIYNFRYSFEGRYFTYSIKNTSTISISKFVMDVSGQITQEAWFPSTQQWNQLWAMPRQQCDVVALCGAYGFCKQTDLNVCQCLPGFIPSSYADWNLKDYSAGCVRETSLLCQLSGNINHAFSPASNMSLPDNPEQPQLQAEECESFCLKNCSCTAYAYDSGSSSCSLWFGGLLSMQRVEGANGQGNTIYIKMNPADKTKKKKTVLVAASVAAALGILLGVFVIVRKKKKKKRMGGAEKKNVDGSLISFRYSELQTATKNFSEKLGGGGFGSVFKGSLPDTSAVAVKKLEGWRQGEKQFRAEVITIGTVRHVNLIRLRGFCSGKRKLLVYEYMQNGSLDSHLFKREGGVEEVLGWKRRYQIALGTARGLVYLHEKCRDCIIHCDIKPENILLDGEFSAKVADFGLAKLVGREFSRVLTTMRGTRGYLAPEWITGVAITAKADVYSYGMMLFEMVSGVRNSDPKGRFFPGRAAALVGGDGEEAEFMKLLDGRLEGDGEVGEVRRLCRVACWCVQDEETHRPSMSQVVQILEGVLEVGLPPVPRCLQLFREGEEGVVFFRKSDRNCSGGTTSSFMTSSTTSGTSSGL